MCSLYFSMAFEQLFLMYEIEKIHPFDPHLTSGLERWITLQCRDAFNATVYKGTKQNGMMSQTLMRELNYLKYYSKGNGSKHANQEYHTNGDINDSKAMKGMHKYGRVTFGINIQLILFTINVLKYIITILIYSSMLQTND